MDTTIARHHPSNVSRRGQRALIPYVKSKVAVKDPCMSHPIPDKALDADIAILGKKGKGKTYTAKGIAERLLDMERRLIVMDPMSMWWGLKSSGDGNKPGYDVAVFGGEHGDRKLNEEMAIPLARVLATENVPTVLDMGQMTKAALIRFSIPFLSELYRTNRRPLTLILEEADVFAPQSPFKDQTVLLSEVDRIARRGRAFGFRLVTITQRTSKLNKDVLTQLSTLVAMGITSPQDRDAIKAWIEGNADPDKTKEVTGTLAKLPKGEGFVWAPDFDLLKRVKFPKIKTLDTSKTPEAGEEPIAPKSLAQVDLSALDAALKTDEKPGKGSKSRQVLSAPDPHALKEAHQAGYSKGFDDGIETARKELQKALSSDGRELMRRTIDLHDEIKKRLGNIALADIESSGSMKLPRATDAPGKDHQKALQNMRAADPEAPGLHRTQQKFLDAIAWLNACTADQPNRKQIAWVAGYKATSGTIGQVLSELNAMEFVTYPAPGCVALTPSGEKLAAAPDRPLKTADLQEMIKAKLSSMPRRLLEVVLDAHPEPIERDELAVRAGYQPTSGTIGEGCSVLKNAGLIEYPGKGMVQASDVLFVR